MLNARMSKSPHTLASIAKKKLNRDCGAVRARHELTDVDIPMAGRIEREINATRRRITT